MVQPHVLLHFVDKVEVCSYSETCLKLTPEVHIAKQSIFIKAVLVVSIQTGFIVKYLLCMNDLIMIVFQFQVTFGRTFL